MDKELRLIRYLYGEDERPEEFEQLLASDQALRTEYRKLKSAKDYLDTRPRQRPNEAVVDRIVAAAGGEAAPAPEPDRPARRSDREPVARARTTWSRVLRVASALAVFLVAVGIGVWQFDGSLSDPATSEAVVDAQSATEQSETSLGRAASQESIPDWDEADDLVRIHHYIETLQARSSPNSWDSPGAMLQPASQVRPSGN